MMKMLLGKNRKLMLSCFLAGVFLAWMLGSAFASVPGSAEDPLVTSSWVENYLDQKYGPLEAQLTKIKEDLADLDTRIILYIGVNKAWIGGKAQAMDAPPQLVGGYTMLPLRFIGEALSVNVDWDNVNKTVTCKRNDKAVVLPVGGKTATIDGQDYALPCAPLLKEGRVLAPARFIAEAFGCRVNWESAQKKVDIQLKQ